MQKAFISRIMPHISEKGIVIHWALAIASQSGMDLARTKAITPKRSWKLKSLTQNQRMPSIEQP